MMQRCVAFHCNKKILFKLVRNGSSNNISNVIHSIYWRSFNCVIIKLVRRRLGKRSHGQATTTRRPRAGGLHAKEDGGTAAVGQSEDTILMPDHDLRIAESFSAYVLYIYLRGDQHHRQRSRPFPELRR